MVPEKVAVSVNTNDQIRQQILQYFYDRNTNATSRFGKKGSAVKISDVKKELKAKHGLTQQQVMSNLTYLIDKGWINVADVEKTVRTSGGTVPSIVAWYEISAQGIDKIEGESEFRAMEKYAGINITASGANIIALGDDVAVTQSNDIGANVVNAQHADLHAQLNELKDAVTASEALTDDEKLDVSIDIETLKDQLAKASPDKTIVRRLWESIRNAVTAADVVAYTAKVAPSIAELVG